ncbi:ABC transporter ATP-binding protein [Paenibacillus sp. LjRoot153]|uniref:ABC transporter ATP-binding protein n=1 Tax=Paenibacillus sp. LjRoot153 TaxID=3342270 RepID=UPI003ECC224D
MLKLFRHLRAFRLLIVLVVLLTVIQTGSELILPTLMASIVDTGIVNQDLHKIYELGSYMVIIALVAAACSVISSYYAATISAGFGSTLREKIYTKVQSLGLSSYHEIGASSLITRTTNDVTQVQNVLQMVLRIMLLAPIMCVGGTVMALSQDVRLSAVLLVVIPLLCVGISLIMWKVFPVSRLIQQQIDHMNLVIREGLTGVRVIRAFHRIKWDKERFQQTNEALRDRTITSQRIMSLNMPVIMLAFNVSTVLILWFGSGRIHFGDLQVGQLMAFIQYANMILMSIVLLSFLFGSLPRAIVSAGRINELLSKESEPANAQASGSSLLNSDQPLTLEFRNVSYRYPSAEGNALSQISFQAQEGEVTAIIGGTGAGKSTLLQLLPRLYVQQSGQILINGVDTVHMPLHQLRSMIGYVPQRSFLFSGSIGENIRYGSPTVSNEEIYQAADVAQATSFILEKSDAFNFGISQGGTNLSGGQKQRLSIARALARKSRIYVFDDSFSALDYKTDAKLRRGLRSHLDGAIVLIVAQRIRTVMDADRIIVLHEGRIAAMGTHQELIRTSDVYREILQSQESGEEPA